jgi:hypothetical protein
MPFLDCYLGTKFVGLMDLNFKSFDSLHFQQIKCHAMRKNKNLFVGLQFWLGMHWGKCHQCPCSIFWLIHTQFYESGKLKHEYYLFTLHLFECEYSCNTWLYTCNHESSCLVSTWMCNYFHDGHESQAFGLSFLLCAYKL